MKLASKNRREHVLLFLLLSAMLPFSLVATEVADFTFIHASDVHAPMAQSESTISRVKALGDVNLAPFSIQAPKPSFAVTTGDLTEFGGGNNWWQEYMGYWKDCPFPVYHLLGNHDNTWHANINALRATGHRTHYSFDAHGCHFVVLMTPMPQDPRPAIAEEQLVWLRADLEKTGPKTPVLVSFHHPLGGSEFASRYDWERLLDVLRPHNTILMMAGHSHGFVAQPVGGLDQVTGGSTFGPNAGFSVVSVKEGTLRVAYWKAAEAVPGTRLLEKKIPEASSYPLIEISSPAFREASGPDLRIYARLGAQPDGKVTYTIDDALSGDLMVAGAGENARAMGRPSIASLLPGAHYLRIEFSSGGKVFSRSTQFYYQPANGRSAWHHYLGASTKVTPTATNGVIYVGANDGVLRAIDAATGKQQWALPTDAEILGSPLIVSQNIIIGNGAGQVIACDQNGKRSGPFVRATLCIRRPSGWRTTSRSVATTECCMP